MLLNKRISIFYFLNLVKFDLIAISGFAVLMGLLDNIAFFKDETIPLPVSALIGTLLSLLLAFRTAQSYDRWWEARSIWGAIVNDSRSLIRELIQFLPEDADKKQTLQRFARRQAAWCYTMTYFLRGQAIPSEVIAPFENEIGAQKHIPNALLTAHAIEWSKLARTHNLHDNLRSQVDTTFRNLTDAMGKCERIKNTVFPRSYSVLIHLLIYVLMAILPFGLDDNHFIIEIGIVLGIPALFISLERTAILMQDPFEGDPTDTPITTISQGIERTLFEMTELPIPNREKAGGRYYVD